MFRPLRVSADLPSPRAPLPLSLIVRSHPEASEGSEVSEAGAGAQG